MEALATDYRTYALDLWGFGDSAKSPSRYNITGYVRLLHDFMGQMGIASAPLIGHSIGGAVALLLAAQHPECVQRIVAVSVPVEANAINRRLRSLSNPLARQLLWRQEADGWIKRLLGVGPIDHAEISQEAAKTDLEAIVESMRSLAAMALEPDLKRIRVPILAIFGREDPIIHVSQASLFEEKLRHARSIVLDKARHFPMLEEPVTFHRLLRDFLVAKEDLEKLQVKEMWHRRTH